MNVVSIAKEAFLKDIFCKHWGLLSPQELLHVSGLISYSHVPDNVIANNQEVIDVIDWDRIGRMQMIRILIRSIDHNIDILDKVDLKKFDYKINEIKFLLRRNPNHIEHFPFDLGKLKTSEAAVLLSMELNDETYIDKEYFLNRINLLDHEFSPMQSMSIAERFHFRRDVLESVDFKSFKGYQISKILAITGEANMDILDIKKLSSIDWINLLEVRPSMLKHCDLNKFNIGDIFYSIRMCCMFDTPDLSHMVMSRDMKSITPFGWEKLLIEKPEIFLAHCNFSKLDGNNWKNILLHHPKLVSYKVD